MTDLTWVLSSCALILVVIALRAAFGRRMRPGLRYALWGLVLLRLLYPGTVLSSPVSVQGVAEQTEVVRNVEAVRGVTSITRADDGTVWGENIREIMPERPVIVAEQVTPERFAHMKTTSRALDILRPLWRFGAIVTAGVFIVSNAGFGCELRKRRKRLDADCPLRMYSVENLSSSCLFGNEIYVAAETAADETRLRHVLAHELSHHRHGDHIWTLLRCAALALHWYNPLVWWAAALSRQDSELCADAGALKRLGEGERESYGATLIELSAHRARRASLLCAATTMTNGKHSLKERVTMIARQPRTSLLVFFVVAAAVCFAAGSAFTGAAVRDGAMTEEEAPARQGEYAGVEDYIASVRSRMATAVYYSGADGSERTANVLDTRLATLEKAGELPVSSPQGVLELYTYLIETRVDVPAEEIAAVGGMYVREDGWCDLEGQGGHALIALRCPDGSYEVLRDRPRNDDWGGIWYYEDTAEELLYDWYVREYGVGLPTYTAELALGGENKLPARRVDGDGWYLYVPVQQWYRDDGGDAARWFSQYNTGSMLAVYLVAEGEAAQPRPSAEGRQEAVYPLGNGTCWRVVTQYDPAVRLRSDLAGLEPAALEAMAASFTLAPRGGERYYLSYVAGTAAVGWSADLDGDGVAERIVLDAPALVPGGAAQVWLEDAAGGRICDLGDAGLPHAGWRTLALTERGGRTYLLDYSPSVFQGEAAYRYTLLELRDGALATVELERVSFSMNPGGDAGNDADAMERFRERANDVWARSRLLFTTDQEVLAHLYGAGGATVEANGTYYIAGAGETVRYRETMGQDAATARTTRYIGDGWYIDVPVIPGVDVTCEARNMDGAYAGELYYIFRAGEDAFLNIRWEASPGDQWFDLETSSWDGEFTLDRENHTLTYSSDDGTTEERYVDKPGGGCYILTLSGAKYLDELRAMADSFTIDPSARAVFAGNERLHGLLAGLDPADATLRFYDGGLLKGSAGGASALAAADYLATLGGITWIETAPLDKDGLADGWRIELDAPGWRLTSYQDPRSVLVETSGGELWLTVRTIPEEQYPWLSFDTLESWYLDAVNGEQHRGGGTPLTEDELAVWREALKSDETVWDETWGGYVGHATIASCFFTSYYSDPRDLDLAEFLYYCPLCEAVEDEAEFDALHVDWEIGEEGNQHNATLDELPVPVHRYRASRINEALLRYAGITLDDLTTDWRHELLYLSDYDAFYNFTSDFGPGMFYPRYGERDGDVVTLYSESAVLRLRVADNGGWTILSHLPN